jgi:hypothetical protein
MCTITRYHCPEDLRAIETLAEEADAQQARNSGFSTIFPWRDLCLNEYHYVARAPNGVLCGWLSAKVKTYRKLTYFYLSEISTRRIRNDLFGGVGQRLHAAFLADAVSLGVDFVLLYPLDAAIRELYQKPEWGYVALRPELNYLFRILKRSPTPAFLNSIMPDNGKSILEDARLVAAQRPRDIDLLTLLHRLAPALLQNTTYLLRLEGELEMMAEFPLLERREALQAFLEEFEGKEDK